MKTLHFGFRSMRHACTNVHVPNVFIFYWVPKDVRLWIQQKSAEENKLLQ